MIRTISFARLLHLAGACLLIASCASAPQDEIAVEEPRHVPREQADALERSLDLASRSDSPEAERHLLDAAELLISNERSDQAEDLLETIDTGVALPDALLARYNILQARLAMERGTPDVAVAWLSSPPLSESSDLTPSQQQARHQLLARAYRLNERYFEAARELIRLSALLEDAAAIESNNTQIWSLLSSVSPTALRQFSGLADSYEFRGWMELATSMVVNQYSIEQQIEALEQWRDKWNQHSASQQLPAPLAYLYELEEIRPSRVALLLPMDEQIGQALSQGFMSAYFQALEQGHRVPEIRVYNTSSAQDVRPLYYQAVDDGAEFIIGPLLKDRVRQLQGLRALEVPTLALNYGDPEVRNARRLYQFGLAPEDEIMQAADMAWRAGHRDAATLTPRGSDYERLQRTFRDYWTGLGGEVLASETFGGETDYADVVRRLMNIDRSQARTDELRELLPRNTVHFEPRRREDIDFLFLAANPGEGRQIKPTLSFYFAGDMPVYALPSIYDGNNNQASNRDLNGVIFTDAPWILENNDRLKARMDQTWSQANGPLQRLRAMGVDSYRLYTRVFQLEQFPGSRLNGATGLLALDSDRTVSRRLAPARFIDGTATLLTGSSGISQSTTP